MRYWLAPLQAAAAGDVRCDAKGLVGARRERAVCHHGRMGVGCAFARSKVDLGLLP